ncbi:uncharacterized protein [Dermacentor andersoni]|uniref:uncharacterized protein n=1 Tax=Dermacentor andersoni TaxID=34620 RepID=UPI003B3B164E
MVLTLLLLAVLPFVDGGGSSPLNPREQQGQLCHQAGNCGGNTSLTLCLFNGTNTYPFCTMCVPTQGSYNNGSNRTLESYWDGNCPNGTVECTTEDPKHSVCVCTW